MARELDVSMVIVNWNTCVHLRNCMRSIYEQTSNVTFEVIVVDNDSHDGSQAMILTEFPEVRFIANCENRGFAAANNQGIGVSRGRYVLLLNSDTLILDNALAKCVKWIDAQPDIAVLGCQVMESDTQVQRTCFRFPSPLNILLDQVGLSKILPRSRFFGREWMGWWDRKSQREVDVVSGMFMLVRREAIEQVGLMDEDYFVYAEEADWCYRFWQSGWRCVFAPIAQIVHLDGGGKSTKQVSVRMHVQLQKSLLLFHRKHYGIPSWVIVRALYACSSAVRAAGWGMVGLVRGGDAWKHKRNQAVAALKFQLLGVSPA